MAHPTHRYLLKWSKMISPFVRHLSFVREDNSPLSFTAGQFMTLHIEVPPKMLHRSYSIANMPDQDDTVELAIAYVKGGVASQLLFDLKPGEAVSASGPYGLFVLKDEKPARYVFIATGTGVTPYRSMLIELEKRFEFNHPELEAIIIFGVRTREELLFKDEFLEFAEKHKNFKFYACYSRETEPNLEPFERKGHVQNVFDELQLNPEKDIVYICGNPNMIDDTFNLLTEKGFDKKNVRREKYLFSRH